MEEVNNKNTVTEEDTTTTTTSTTKLKLVKVLIIRHGQVENPTQIFYGRRPGFGLAEIGKEQALMTGRYLSTTTQTTRATTISALYSSPMLRARETADCILSELQTKKQEARNQTTTTTVGENEAGLKIIICDDFIEVDSPFEGVPLSKMFEVNWQMYNPEIMCKVLETSTPPTYYETFEQVYDRVVKGIQRIVKKALLLEDSKEDDGHDDSTTTTVAVITHGDICFAALLWGKGQPPETMSTMTRSQFFKEYFPHVDYPAYCSITSLLINEHGDCIDCQLRQGYQSDQKKR